SRRLAALLLPRPLRRQVLLHDLHRQLLRVLVRDEAALPVAVELAQPEPRLPARAEVASRRLEEPAGQSLDQPAQHDPDPHAEAEHRLGGPSGGHEVRGEPEDDARGDDADRAPEREVPEDARSGLGDPVELRLDRALGRVRGLQCHTALLPLTSRARPATRRPARSSRITGGSAARRLGGSAERWMAGWRDGWASGSRAVATTAI